MEKHQRKADDEPSIIGAQKAQAMYQVLADTAACGLRRRASDAAEVPLVSELVGLEWLAWEAGRLRMTPSGQEGSNLLRRHLEATSNTRTSFQFPG